MTEKSYGGSAPFRKEIKSGKAISGMDFSEKEKKSKREESEDDSEFNKEKTLKAGKIASEVRHYAKEIVKKDVPLIEIADKIEKKIIHLGGKPAFPTNLSINDIAAHYTPAFNDQTKAHGLLKVDFGVHVDGWVADTALSFDLDGNEENRQLIEAAEKALENALNLAKHGVHLGKIGEEIQKTIESYKAYPISNLCGHSITHYDLHSGTSVPNYNNESKEAFGKGIYAIEPFATFGNGKVYDGGPSGIYSLIDERNVRNPTARKILNFVLEEYSTLPFCSRWIVEKFGPGALFGLKQLEDNGNLHQYSHLVEVSHRNVAQAEHTIFIEKGETKVTTK